MPAAPGRRFGEILGRNIGEIELTPGLFLPVPLAASNGVLRGFVPPDPGVNCGLWLADAAAVGFANTGEGSGWKVDARPEARSVDGVAVPFPVTSGDSFGFGKFPFTDAGNSKPSMGSNGAGSEGFKAVELGALDTGNFISVAGVAGDGFPGGPGTVPGTWVPLLCCGRKNGDLLAVRGWGSGGGGISERSSGDTDASSG
jgi:hypothetical protein